MIIVDAHCDTLTKAVDAGMSLTDNPLHWDITRAGQYDGFVQVLAIFQGMDKVKPDFNRAMLYIEEAKKYQKRYPFFSLCNTYSDIEKGLKEKKVCGLLSIEGGDVLKGEIQNLIAFYNAGIRCITLTWNNANELGDGALEQLNRGLTPFGREVVQWMENNGVIVDISHSSEKTFWDCIDAYSGPIIASHSNARAVYDHPRNLWDEQLLAISRARGVIGINFFTEFITEPDKSDLAALIRHIEHIAGVAGEDAVGLGADFDGMQSLPEPIVGVQSLNILFNELARLNYTDRTITKIAGGNFLRVFREVLRNG
jgi:membrane dipeptidase